jgi:hypothetical protein
MNRFWSRSFMPAGLLAFALYAGAAGAEPSQADQAAAQALFQEGRALAKAGDHAKACVKLEESQRLAPAPGTQLGLAECYERLGRTASAWSAYLEVATSSAGKGPKDRQTLARSRATALEPKLTRLTLSIAPEASQMPGFSVTRNGAGVGRELWGAAIAVDPGQHTLEASAPGMTSWTQTVDVSGEGKTTSVAIPALEAAPPPAASAPPVSSAPPAEPVPPPAASASAPAAFAPTQAPAAPPAPSAPGQWDNDTMRTVAWAGLGVGAAAIVTGIVTGAMAMGKKGTLDDACTDDRRCPPDSGGQIDTYNGLRTASTVGFVLGVVGLGGGAFILWQGARESKTRTAAVPQINAYVGAGTLGMGGSF